MTDARPAFAWRPVGLVVALQATLLLAMAPHYGPHRDELYFVSAGRRLDWGYPDQPSFTPLLAQVSTEMSEHSLVVLRLWSIVAVAATVLLAVQFSRLLGGARKAQVLTAICVASGAVVIAVGHRLSTATFDTLAWTAVLVVVVQAVVDDRPRLWLVAGLVAGIGLNNKHAVAFLLLGILVALALDRHTRPALRTPWPWVAGAYATLLWVPNLVWQWRHDWPALTLSADIAEEYGGVGGRIGMLAEAFAMFSPLIGVLWVIGTVQLLRREEWHAARLPAYVLLVVTVVFLATGGKGYYLAGAIVPLIAAGSTWLAARLSLARVRVAAAALGLSAMVAWPALVPVLFVQDFVDSFYPALDDDQAETIGWPGYAEQVREVVEDNTASEPVEVLMGPPGGVLSFQEVMHRRVPVVFTGNYGEAGAFEWYGVGAPVLSGHNGWRNWGPPPAPDPLSPGGPDRIVFGERVVVVGIADPTTVFRGCTEETTLKNGLGLDNEEQGAPVWVCQGPDDWAAVWDDLVHYDA